MVQYFSDERPAKSCNSSEDIVAFFKHNKKALFVDCVENGGFSHCQQFYLMQFDSMRKMCQTFKRQKYIHNKGYTGTTLSLQLSMDRVTRLPYIFERWKGAVSIGIMIKESEIEEAAKMIQRFMKKSKLVFTIYIQKTITESNTPYYSYPDGKKQYFPNGMYPVNIMRDLSIESITTTHYMLTDVDVFLSKSIQSTIDSYSDILQDHHNLVVLPLFEYRNSSVIQKCFKDGVCGRLWNRVPTTKSEVLERFDSGEIQIIEDQYHNVMNMSEWREYNGRLMLSRYFNHMEPYGVFRRSAADPIFHPYFIDYGGNKMELYFQFRAMNYNTPYVFPSDFGFNIPHKRTSHSVYYKQSKDIQPMNKQYWSFLKMYKIKAY
ncbi:hypothetical protein WA577_002959 [Blastocystis sp. JDR]